MKKRFCKILAFMLLLSILSLAFLSCKNSKGYYSEIKSSKTEKTVVMKLGGEDIRYEVLRFFYFVHQNDAETFEEKMNLAIWETAELYATFAVCPEYGIDPFSDEINDKVNDYIKLDIDGGYLNEDEEDYIAGYGSVSNYKESLASRHLTDYVNRLLYRYTVCLSALYQTITISYESNQTTIAESELQNFFLDNKTYHFNLVYIPDASRDGNHEEARSRIAEIRSAMVESDGTYDSLIEVAFRYSYASNYTLLSSEDIEFGIYATDETLDSSLNKTLLETIKTTQSGEISSIIETESGFYIVYGMNKSLSSLNNQDLKDEISILYLENVYYKYIATLRESYSSNYEKMDVFNKLTEEKILSGNL